MIKYTFQKSLLNPVICLGHINFQGHASLSPSHFLLHVMKHLKTNQCIARNFSIINKCTLSLIHTISRSTTLNLFAIALYMILNTMLHKLMGRNSLACIGFLHYGINTMKVLFMFVGSSSSFRINEAIFIMSSPTILHNF